MCVTNNAKAQFQWEGLWKVKGEFSTFSDLRTHRNLYTYMMIRAANDSVYVCLTNDVDPWLPFCKDGGRVYRYPLSGRAVTEKSTESYDVSYSVFIHSEDGCASPFMTAVSQRAGLPEDENGIELSHQLTLRVNTKGQLEGSFSSRWACQGMEGVDASFVSLEKQKGRR